MLHYVHHLVSNCFCLLFDPEQGVDSGLSVWVVVCISWSRAAAAAAGEALGLFSNHTSGVRVVNTETCQIKKEFVKRWIVQQLIENVSCVQKDVRQVSLSLLMCCYSCTSVSLCGCCVFYL